MTMTMILILAPAVPAHRRRERASWSSYSAISVVERSDDQDRAVLSQFCSISQIHYFLLKGHEYSHSIPLYYAPKCGPNGLWTSSHKIVMSFACIHGLIDCARVGKELIVIPINRCVHIFFGRELDVASSKCPLCSGSNWLGKICVSHISKNLGGCVCYRAVVPLIAKKWEGPKGVK